MWQFNPSPLNKKKSRRPVKWIRGAYIIAQCFTFKIKNNHEQYTCPAKLSRH